MLDDRKVQHIGCDMLPAGHHQPQPSEGHQPPGKKNSFRCFASSFSLFFGQFVLLNYDICSPLKSACSICKKICQETGKKIRERISVQKSAKLVLLTFKVKGLQLH